MLNQFPFVDSLWQDVRYAFRNMLRSPGFTSIVVLCLALGIGANTAMFSVINSVLLRPLPFKDSDRLISLYATPISGHPEYVSMPSLNAYYALQSDPAHFEEVTAYEETSATLTGANNPASVRAAWVPTNFFPMLGVPPALGRIFGAADLTSAQAAVAVLSYSSWRNDFAGDPGIIGKTFFFDGASYAVVGVMPKLFNFPQDADIWLPTKIEDVTRFARQTQSLRIVARTQRGQNLAQTQAALAALARRLHQTEPNVYNGRGLIASSIAEGRVARVRQALMLLFASVGLVLLIACANVSNLFLARGWNRKREFSIRAALGAGKARIARQMLVESVLIALLGGGAGFAIASVGVGLLRSIAPSDIPRIDQVGIDLPVYWFALLVSFGSGTAFGILPAAQSAKDDLNFALKEGHSSATASRGQLLRFRDLLTAAEVALCLVLLIGSILVVRSLIDMLDEDMGFGTDHLLTMRVGLPKNEYSLNKQRVSAILNIVDHVRSVPGVEAASVKTNPFLGSMGSSGDFRIGTSNGPPTERYTQVRYILSAYFDALRVPMIRGRAFNAADDRLDAPIAIVNESFAKRYFSGNNPIGEHIFEPGFDGKPEKLREIVGEVSDFRDSDIVEAPKPTVFIPFTQCPFQDPFNVAFIAARTAIPPAVAAKSIERAIWSVGSDFPIDETETGEQLISDLLVEPKFQAVLLSTFAGLGLILSLIGIFGVVSYSVGQRTREIGIRIALGAERSNILRLVLRGGMLPVLVGIAIGAGGALALTHLIQSFLYGVKPTDPLSFIAAAASFCAVALLACYQPARRATRVDPLVALRYD